MSRVTAGGPAEKAGLRVGDKILQVNGYDMTMATQKQAKKRLTKNQRIIRVKVTRGNLVPNESVATSIPQSLDQSSKSHSEYV